MTDRLLNSENSSEGGVKHTPHLADEQIALASLTHVHKFDLLSTHLIYSRLANTIRSGRAVHDRFTARLSGCQPTRLICSAISLAKNLFCSPPDTSQELPNGRPTFIWKPENCTALSRQDSILRPSTTILRFARLQYYAAQRFQAGQFYSDDSQYTSVLSLYYYRGHHSSRSENTLLSCQLFVEKLL